MSGFVSQHIKIRQIGTAYSVPADSSTNGWNTAHDRYDFAIDFGTTTIQVPIFVPASIPAANRDATAIQYFKNMIAAIAIEVAAIP